MAKDIDKDTAAAKYGWTPLMDGPQQCGACAKFSDGYCLTLNIATLAMSGCTKKFTPNPLAPERDERVADWVEAITGETAKPVAAAPQPPARALPDKAQLEKLVQANGMERDYANQLHGKFEVAHSMRKFFRAAEIQFFKEIRDSKLFKYISIKHQDGSFRPAENFSKYCEIAHGVSSSKVYEEISDLDLLGEEAYETIQSLGLHRNQKRALRQLPETKAKEIAQELNKEEVDQGRLKNFVLDVLADHARQIEEVKEAHAAEKQAMTQDKEKLVAETEKLKKDLEREKRRSDADIAEETKTIRAELNSALAKTRELEAKLGGDYAQAKQAASAMSDRVLLLLKDFEAFNRALPTDATPPPPELMAQMEGLTHHVKTIGDTLWKNWRTQVAVWGGEE